MEWRLPRAPHPGTPILSTPHATSSHRHDMADGLSPSPPLPRGGGREAPGTQSVQPEFMAKVGPQVGGSGRDIHILHGKGNMGALHQTHWQQPSEVGVPISPTVQIWKLGPREVNQPAKVAQLVSCGFKARVYTLDHCACRQMNQSELHSSMQIKGGLVGLTT